MNEYDMYAYILEGLGSGHFKLIEAEWRIYASEN